MKKSDVTSRVVGIFHECGFTICPDQYDYHIADLGIDSLAFVEVIMELEKAFKILIVDEHASVLNTVNKIIAFIVGVKQIEA